MIERLDSDLRDRLGALVDGCRDVEWAMAAESALQPRETMSGTEWAECHLWLDEHVSPAAPGPFRVARTPYLRGLIDALCGNRAEKVVFLKSTQIGGTLAMMAAEGYFIDQDPGPAMHVMPTEKDARSFADERMLPLLEGCERLSRHIPSRKADMTKDRFRLATMDLHFGWGGSASMLASRAKRIMIFDEADKYTQRGSAEADPISLGYERMRTFWNRKCAIVSTPTVAGGVVSREYRASAQHRYFVPCPHCGTEQPLRFENVRYPEAEGAERIKAWRLAWYLCAACEGRIDERHKSAMVAAGRWRMDPDWFDREVLRSRTALDIDTDDDAEPEPQAPAGLSPAAWELPDDADMPRVWGFHINALYSPWLGFSDVAAEFVSSQRDSLSMRNFRNSWEGLPYEETTAELDAGMFRDCIADYQSGEVPADALVLTFAADVQQDHVWWSVRAWAQDERSWLIDWGVSERPDDPEAGDEFEQVGLLIDSMAYERDDGVMLPISKAAVDSRFRTKRVYEFVRPRRRVLVPTKGAKGRQVTPWRLYDVDKLPSMKHVIGGLQYASLDVTHYKDVLAEWFGAEKKRFFVPRDVARPIERRRGGPTNWVDQFCSEHRVVVGKDIQGPIYRWKLRPGARDDHLKDCEVLHAFLADLIGVPRGKIQGIAPAKGKGPARRRWFTRKPAK